jgi:deazaflavin-dependent oxidoreductase (nitroreductase family)
MSPLLIRLMNPMMAFMIRRNIGALGQAMMIITHTGRKSGRQYSTPIGYLRDGDSVLGFNVGGGSQWYKNLKQNPVVTLTIQGQSGRYRARYITDTDEIARVLALYQRGVPKGQYERFFGVPVDMPAEQAARSPQLRAVFVRFQPE